LFYAINIESMAFLEEEQDLSAWSKPVLLVELVFLIIQCVGYTLLAILLDVWSSNPQFMRVFNNVIRKLTCHCGVSATLNIDVTTALPEDGDDVAEEKLVLSGGTNNDLIVLSQLSKTYSSGKVAVNQFSLGIPHGECFGLLGINGTFPFLLCFHVATYTLS
jgi:hypothetical protein